MPELIDRQELKNHLYRAQAEAFKRSEWYVAGSIQSFIDLLESQPTIEPEVRIIPKEVSATDIDKLTEMIKGSLLQAYPNDVTFTAVRHGRWIVRGQDIYCSECNEECLYNPFGASKFSHFCPNCGSMNMDLRTSTEVQLDVADSVMMGGADNG